MLFKNGLVDEAYKLLDEMKQTYWLKHIQSTGFSHEFITSIELLDELSENESVPVDSSYRNLTDNYIKAGRLEISQNLLEEISSSPSFEVANKYLYTSLIKNLSHASKVDKALELYASMIRKNVVLEFSILFHLIKGLIKVDKQLEASLVHFFSYSFQSMKICWQTWWLQARVVEMTSLLTAYTDIFKLHSGRIFMS